jgi:hypothetical protein
VPHALSRGKRDGRENIREGSTGAAPRAYFRPYVRQPPVLENEVKAEKGKKKKKRRPKEWKLEEY